MKITNKLVYGTSTTSTFNSWIYLACLVSAFIFCWRILVPTVTVTPIVQQQTRYTKMHHMHPQWEHRTTVAVPRHRLFVNQWSVQGLSGCSRSVDAITLKVTRPSETVWTHSNIQNDFALFNLSGIQITKCDVM